MLSINYLKTRLKANFRYFPSALIFTSFIAVLLALLLNAIIGLDSDKVLAEKASVGLVADAEDKYLKTGLSAIKSLDVSKDYLDIVLFDSEEMAENAVRNGEILGYMYLPDGFIRSVLSGENSKAKFVSKNTPNDLLPLIVNEVISTVSDLVVESQTGIFAMENLYIDNHIENLSKDLKAINIKYISFVIARDDMVSVSELGNLGFVNLQQYYFCAFFVLIVILIGVLCVRISVRRDTELYCLLESRGCKFGIQVMFDFITFVIVPALSVFFVFVLAFALNKFGILELSSLFRGKILSFYFKALPAVILICAMQFMIYELCENVVSASLLQFVLSIGLAYLSGCIYPISFFPDFVREFAVYLPLGTALQFLKDLAVGNFNLLQSAVCLIYALALIFVSYIIRKVKIRGTVA